MTPVTSTNERPRLRMALPDRGFLTRWNDHSRASEGRTMHRKVRTLIPAALAAALVCAAASDAHAQAAIPRDEGFMKPPTSVQHRRYTLDGRTDFALFGTLSIKNQLTEHYGAMLVFDKSFNEYLALDILVGGGAGQLTSLAGKLREAVKPSGATTVDDLADAGQLFATGQIGLRFTPFYGKLNLAAEVPLNFSLYFNAGVGGAYVKYESILACSKNRDAGNKCPNNEFRSELAPTLGVNVGGGFRFFINDTWSARVEFRDVMFPDRYNEAVNLKTPVNTPGRQAANAGITHTPLVMLGIGFML